MTGAEQSAKWRKQNPVKAMVSRCRMRAARRGIPFGITEADVHIPEVCPVLGVPLVVGDPEYAPSLDRIKPEVGYLPGNVIVVSVRANRVRNNGTPDEHLKIAWFYRWWR